MMHESVLLEGRAAACPLSPAPLRDHAILLDHSGLRNLDELPNVEELLTLHLPVARPSAGSAGPSSSESSNAAS